MSLYEELEVGDAVRVWKLQESYASSAPRMIVGSKDEATQQVACFWFDTMHRIQENLFLPLFLRKDNPQR